MLQFVARKPEYLNVCGAAWCSDGKHFISNSTILGKTLNIKPNTINTNFRSHFFKIIPSKSPDLTKEFPDITDMRNWKKRVNEMYGFNSSSYIEDINLIPCQPIPSPKSSRRNNLFNQNYSPSLFSLSLNYAYPQQINNCSNGPSVSPQTPVRNGPEIGCNIYKNLPAETQQLLSSDQDTMLNTVILMNKISNDLEKNRVLAVFATNDWIQVAGNVSKVEPDVIVDAIYQSYDKRAESMFLRTNISYLLLFDIESTQQEELLSFDKFFDFFLRYGPISKAASYINDLTVSKYEQGFFSSQDQSFDSQSSSNFRPWFQPSFTASVSKRILEGQPVHSWLLRPSSTPGKFTVQYKEMNKGKKSVFATYIEFNPLADQDEKPFSVLVDKVGMVGADSWNEILFDIMKLDADNCISLNVQSKSSSIWSDQINEGSPFLLSPMQVDLQISSSQQRFF